MILIPFIYFSLYFLFIYKKNGFDIAAYTTLIYTITAFFSIILYNTNEEYGSKEITFIPTFIYCFLITILIQPFVNFKHKLRSFNPHQININIFNAINTFFIISFLFTLLLFWNDIIIRLSSSDFKEMRGADDIFMQTAQSKLNGPLRLLSSVFGIFNSMSWIMVIMFYYSICFLNRSKIYNVLLLLSSTSCIILGIIGIDRSIVYYWLILFFLSYIIFQKYIPTKSKRLIFIISVIIISSLLTYFIAVTVSRFGDNGNDNQGALDSIISYAGQNFINFCWFWENFTLPEVNLSGIFPATYRFILGEQDGAVNYGQNLELKLGYFINYFYTFLGSWLIYVGHIGTIIMTFVYTIIIRCSLKYKGELNLGSIIQTYILIIVPLCGAILYIYTSYMRTISAIVLFIMAYFLSQKKINKRKS